MRDGVLGQLRPRFLSPSAAKELRQIAAEELASASKGNGELARLRTRRAKLVGQIENLIGFIESGTVSDAVTSQLAKREAEAKVAPLIKLMRRRR